MELSTVDLFKTYDSSYDANMIGRNKKIVNSTLSSRQWETHIWFEDVALNIGKTEVFAVGEAEEIIPIWIAELSLKNNILVTYYACSVESSHGTPAWYKMLPSFDRKVIYDPILPHSDSAIPASLAKKAITEL